MAETRWKRRHPNRFRGRGVAAAQQTFNLAGEGSSPSGPTSHRLLEMGGRRLTTRPITVIVSQRPEPVSVFQQAAQEPARSSTVRAGAL